MQWRAIEQAVETYRKQFEIENGQLVFRRNQKGAPVPVSETDAEESVAQFRRLLRIVNAAGFLGLVGVIAALMAVSGTGIDEAAMWLLILVWGMLFGLGFWWAWSGPSNRFERRAPVGRARTSADLRRMMLSAKLG